VAGYIAARELVLAERDGTPVGCVRYRDQDEDTGWFGLLAADPDTAGSGVGRVPVEAVEAMARTAGHRWIERDLLIGSVATPHQSRLHDWYARRGYREIDRAAFRLSDDALAAALRWPCVSIRERKQLKQLGPGE
jgi:N-acetylglutamate synthase-like GNAT family acetyltransferase